MNNSFDSNEERENNQRNFNGNLSSEISENDKNKGSINDQLDLNYLINVFIRRRRLILSLTSFIFGISILYTGYKRIFNPVYLGSFTLLISDPLNNQGDVGSPNLNVRNGLFEELARNTTKNDSPTLIELLKSDLLIKPIATEFNIEKQKLQKSLSIGVPLSGQDKFLKTP